MQTVNRLQQLLAELAPGKVKKDITTGQARVILASVHPRRGGWKDPSAARGRAAHRAGGGGEEIKALTKELKEMVLARGSTLMDSCGVGPVVAARIVDDVGDVARFADHNRFASWSGNAPLDASSGEQIRHRLSRARNRE